MERRKRSLKPLEGSPKSRKSSLIIALAVAALTFLGCKERKDTFPTHLIGKIKPVPSYGGRLSVGTIGDVSTFLPILATDSASHEVASMIYNGLVKYNGDLEIVGDLAEGWEVLDGGKVIRFYLRKGVKWQDGYPFTADDVIWTYKVMVDPNTPTAYAGDFLMIKNIEKIDNYTIDVVYKEPFSPALSSWGISILPAHILKKEKNITKSSLVLKPVGTGPYRLKKWTPGLSTELIYNKDYFMGRPYIDTIIYRVIPDPTTMFMELQLGNIDWMDLTPLQFARETNSDWFRRNFKKYRYLAFAYTYLGFDLRDPLFRDKRVRQAISYAIDKEEIVKGALLGLGVVATGPYKPGTYYYNPNVRKYPYDPQKALRILHQCGWRDTDGDGILDKNGRPFSFTILTNQGNVMRRKTAEIIQFRLSQIGIKVKIRVVEWASFIKEFIDKRRFQAVILGWTIGEDPDLFDVWHSSKTGPHQLNFMGYKNPEVDELLEEGRRVFDRVKRKKIYDRIQEILAEDQPYVFLYVPYALPIVNRRIFGIVPKPAGISYNIERWYIPKPLQVTISEY